MRRFPPRFISTYKMNSIFIKMFIILLSMSVLMFTSIYIFFEKVLSDNLQEKAYISNHNTLVAASNYIDQNLIGIGRIMNQILWNTDVVGVILVPDMAGYARKVEVLKSMSDLVQNNPLITEAYLLVHGDHTVFCINGEIEPETAFSRPELLDAYLNGRNDTALSFIPGDGFHTVMLVKDGSIALIQRFPVPEANGSLMLVLNNDTLFQGIGQIETDSSSVLVNTATGTLVYPSYAAIKKHDMQSAEDNSRIGYLSPITNWNYRYTGDSFTINMSFRDTMAVIAPLLFVFLILCVVLSVNVSAGIYRPVSKLFQTVLGDASAPPLGMTAKNELEYIQISYENAIQQNGELLHRMASIAPALREKLYRNLLFGKEFSPSYIEETLECANSPLLPEDRYTVLVAAFFRMHDKTLSELEVNLFHISVNNLARNVIGVHKYDCVATDDNRLVMIIAFDKDASDAFIKHIVAGLCDSLKENTKTMPYELCIGKAKTPRTAIANLDALYKEAQNDLNHLLYLAGGDENDPRESTREPASASKVFDYEQRYQEMMHLSLEGKGKEAVSLLDQTVREFRESAVSFLQESRMLDEMVDTFVEKLIALQTNPDELRFADIHNRDGAKTADEEAWRQNAYRVAQRSLALLEVYGKKARFHYVEQAKSYIQEFFLDSSMSLNMVADYVGISTAYLSRLFYEISNQRFIDYLNQCRVDGAKQLLDRTSIPIQEIGFKTGFNSAQSFNRVFKRYTGITPSQYRRRY